MSFDRIRNCFVICLTSSLIGALGCSSATKQKQLSPEEKKKQDVLYESTLASRFESTFQVKRNEKLEKYMERLVKRLQKKNRDLDQSPIKVRMIESLDGRWRTFNIPPSRIYLPLAYLRKIEFENELAGVLSIELAHLFYKNTSKVIRGLEGARGINRENINRSFAYEEDDQLLAIEKAVQILYSGGYDARGIAYYYQKMRSSKQKSPYALKRINNMIARSREILSLFAPMRNPIVRSTDFIRNQPRFKKL